MPNLLSWFLKHRQPDMSDQDYVALRKMYDENLAWLYRQMAEQRRLTAQIDRLSIHADLRQRLEVERDECLRKPLPDPRWSTDAQAIERARLQVIRQMSKRGITLQSTH